MKHLILLAFFLPTISLADVVNKGEAGFNLRITGNVNTTPAEAFAQFIQIGEWWVKSHTWFGNADNLSIDARPGGCFCEKSGDREALHMLVTYVDPGQELKMVGGLGPLQMMGLQGGMSWRFEATDTGTRITQTYNVSGYAPGGLSDIADIVDAVQTQQLNALVNKLNAD